MYLWWGHSAAASGRISSASVRASFINAVTTSFGSVCRGSLLVALVKVLRTALHFSAENLRKLDGATGRSVRVFMLQCLERAVAMLERVVRYFNKYAFCYVAMYGYSFLDSSK